MKKSKVLLIAAMFTAASLAAPFTVLTANAASSSASPSSVDGFDYDISDSKVTITGYKGSSTIVEIPSKISGNKVVAIGSKAFKGNTKITSVVIPSSVSTIGKSAFSGCKGLETIALTTKISEIKDCAFYKDNSLSTVNYSGTSDDWKSIIIGDGNDSLLDAKINYGKNASGKKKNTKVPKTKKDFTVEYTSKLTYNGEQPTMEDLGPITVTFNDETYQVEDIKINQSKKKFQILELKGAEEKLEKTIKTLTKGNEGISFKIKPYKVTSEDDVSVKLSSKNKIKRVRIMLNNEYRKVDSSEYEFNKDSWKLTFKGDRFKGSYVVQDSDIE